jgi:hypothetical protein
MSLLDQPKEIIIEQLKYLSVEDFLNACQTNSRVSQICNERRIWDIRLINDFKVEGILKITNPKNYYFSLLQDREKILNMIISKLSQDVFWSSNWIQELGMMNYEEFIDVQKNAINQLTERDINDINALLNLFPKLQYAELNSGAYPSPTSFFYYYNLYNNTYEIILIHI